MNLWSRKKYSCSTEQLTLGPFAQNAKPKHINRLLSKGNKQRLLVTHDFFPAHLLTCFLLTDKTLFSASINYQDHV